jgi:hypothetical protein
MSGKFITKPDYLYLLDYFPDNVIFMRFRTLLTETIETAGALGIDESVNIDRESMEMVVLDYFSDIARVKYFHNIKQVNVQQMHAYEMFCFLRRHPVQICKPFINGFDINEKIAIAIFVPRILREAGIIYSKTNQDINKDTLNNFINSIFYHIKYSSYTQQSLELMIEAFFFGCNCRVKI